MHTDLLEGLFKTQIPRQLLEILTQWVRSEKNMHFL